MVHHSLDIYPIPKEKSPLYINEPWLIDQSLLEDKLDNQEPKGQKDNIRVYMPMDINRVAVLRRLSAIISRYGEANEDNEPNFQMDVEAIIAQIEIYDQIWFVRNMPKNGKHSTEAVQLVKEFVSMLKEIPDGCAELFPFETIDALEQEYLV